jgi:hypothetical protein
MRNFFFYAYICLTAHLIFAQIGISVPPFVSSSALNINNISGNQIINITTLDTSLYSGMFSPQPDIIPVGGYLGWPISILDYNNDSNNEYFGCWYADSSSTGYCKSAMAIKDTFFNTYEISFFFPDTSVEYIGDYDINSDGNPDFLVSAIDSGRYYSLRCYTNNELTGYPDSLLFKQFILPGLVIKPCIGYFDGDSLTDMIMYTNTNVPGGCSSCISFYEYDPNLNKFVLVNSYDLTQEYREVACADFDSDGHLEFITGTNYGGPNSCVYAYKNIGNNNYAFLYSRFLPILNLYIARAGQDLDNDGNKDLFMAGTQIGSPDFLRLYWLIYTAQSIDINRELTISGVNLFIANHMDLYDVDNDGDNELVFNFGSSILVLKWVDPIKSFKVFYFRKLSPGESAEYVTFKDLDGDDYPELFISVSRPDLSYVTYILHNDINPVPVELSSFTAEFIDNTVKLKWTTVTETNNKGFEIQRSEVRDEYVNPLSEKSEWEKIGYVAGYGTTTKPNAYVFEDRNVKNGIYKYRLKQIDFDGSFKYSKEISISLNPAFEFSLEQNFPNPFNPSTKISWQLPVRGQVSLKVYDILGNEVATLVNEEKSAGIYEVNFNAVNLPSGVYFYRIKAGDFIQTKKMILLK